MRDELHQPQPQTRSHSVASRMAIYRHPVHPMLVVYPVAFLSMLLPADLMFLWRADPFWASAAFWLNVVGLTMGLLAGVIGMLDMMLIRVVRRHVSAWNHFIAAVMLLALAAAGLWLRFPDPAAAVWPWGLLLSSLTLVMVMIAGWLGGTLTFRFGVGGFGALEERENDPEGDEDDHDPPAP